MVHLIYSNFNLFCFMFSQVLVYLKFDYSVVNTIVNNI